VYQISEEIFKAVVPKQYSMNMWNLLGTFHYQLDYIGKISISSRKDYELNVTVEIK